MENNLVTIDNLRYEKLIEAFTKLEIIKKTVEKDENSYGYSSDTKKVIEAVLGVKRA